LKHHADRKSQDPSMQDLTLRGHQVAGGGLLGTEKGGWTCRDPILAAVGNLAGDDDAV
jgi:hypothetical protein